MENLWLYFLKVNLLLIVFYVLYRLFLKNETFFEWVRYYFIGSILSSFILPFLYHYKTVTLYEDATINNTITEHIASATIESADKYLTSEHVLLGFYLIGFLWMLYRLLKAACILLKLIKQSQQTQLASNIIAHPAINNVFSFTKWIVLPASYHDIPDLDTVIAHERIHVKQLHSVDIILIEVLHCLFWINPVLYLIKKDMRLNLEYLVDAEITKETHSYIYQKTLLHTFSNSNLRLASSFNATELKKRIIMLNTKKSKNMKKLKFALAVPFIVAFFFAFQVKTVAQVQYVYNKQQPTDKRTASTHFLYATDSKDTFKKMASSLKKMYKIDLSFINIQQKNGKIVSFEAVVKGKKKTYTRHFGKGQVFESLELTVDKLSNEQFSLALNEINNNNSTYVYTTKATSKSTNINPKIKKLKTSQNNNNTSSNKREDEEANVTAYVINGQDLNNTQVYSSTEKKEKEGTMYVNSYSYTTNLDKESLTAAKKIIIQNREERIALATAEYTAKREKAAVLLDKKIEQERKKMIKAQKAIQKQIEKQQKQVSVMVAKARIDIAREQERLKNNNSQSWEIIETRLPLPNEQN